MSDQLSVRDALFSFAPGEPLRAALFLTYSFDGRWFEEAIVPESCERTIDRMLVVRDRNALTAEAPSVRYCKANAGRSAVFHPKLCLLVSERQARAVISSANLTRGGFERQREMGRVHDLGPDATGDLGLFTALVDYLRAGVSTELCGQPARDLDEIASALHELVTSLHASLPSPAPTPRHTLLHNYAQPIWSQLLQHLPHRVLGRAVIVSPFFEPDRKRPEDPALGPEDSSIFARLLFEDFEFDTPRGEAPVRVFFRQSEGRTELPVHKLGEARDKVAFFTQDEREKRLHAKLILLEGARGPGREPFLVALHGSPNFTTAGLLRTPPHGNSELAVLTTLPVKSKAMSRCISVLKLDRGFVPVADLGGLTSIVPGDSPEPPARGTADVTFLVAEGTVRVSLGQVVPGGARVRICLLRDGAWIPIGEEDLSGLTEIPVPVKGLVEFNEQTRLLELRGTTIRIEILTADGTVLASDECPVNVDIPEQFCGLALVGSALQSLDERIARAGIGIPSTYREQQKWLEARKTEGSAKAGPSVTVHQADLDRFYRNIHQGLRGILARCKHAPGSVYSTRRSLDELTRWSLEAFTNDDAVPSPACRLYLVHRLLRSIHEVLDSTSEPLRDHLPAIVSDLAIAQRITQVATWLEHIDNPAFLAYAAESRAHAAYILNACTTREAP